MGKFVEKSLVAQHCFTSFEFFSNRLRDYNLDLKQIGRGSFSAILQQIQSGPVFINRFTTSCRLEANGNPPQGFMTFGIPTTDCQPFVWRDKQTSGNTIQIYKPNTELALITQPKFEAIDVSIAETDFNRLNQQWGLPELDKIIDKREMVVCEPIRMHQLRSTLKHICETINSSPYNFRHNVDLQDLIEYEVPHLLVQALMNSKIHNIKATPDKRNHALKIALEYIRSTSGEVTSVNKLCRKTGINERTLQRAFLEQYGVTPKSYIQAHRLNNAYKALLHNDPETTRIAEIASSLGYWHMSQFAADYRRQFGELPSDTLKNQGENKNGLGLKR